jgi:hypothetical protein
MSRWRLLNWRAADSSPQRSIRRITLVQCRPSWRHTLEIEPSRARLSTTAFRSMGPAAAGRGSSPSNQFGEGNGGLIVDLPPGRYRLLRIEDPWADEALVVMYLGAA